MRKFFISIAVLLATAALLSCGIFYSAFPRPNPTPLSSPAPTAIPTQPAQKLPQLSGNWHISMAQTGGIAGVSRTLEISSSGEMTITEERIHKKNTTQLPTDKFTTLKELVASSKYRPITQLLGCADCFIFNLQIDNGGEKFQVEIDQVNLPDSGLEPLVGFLGELLNSN